MTNSTSKLDNVPPQSSTGTPVKPQSQTGIPLFQNSETGINQQPAPSAPSGTGEPPGEPAPHHKVQTGKIESALKRLPRLLRSYFHAPVDTLCTAAEKKDVTGGLTVMCLSMVLSLFSTLLFGLVQLKGLTYWDFGYLVLPWLGFSLLGPLVAYGITIGTICLLAAIGKKQINFLSVIAVTGTGSILPTVILAVSVLAGMISPLVFECLAILMCAAWLVSFFTIAFRVFDFKVNTVNTIILTAGIAIAIYAMTLLLTWFCYTESHTLLGLLTW